MKTTSLFKAVALVAIMIASVLNSEVKAQDGFITNQVMNGELVASKTIFKKDGSGKLFPRFKIFPVSESVSLKKI